jgi:hypothetical protein
MTGAQRRNAKMDAMFERAREQGHTTLYSGPKSYDPSQLESQGFVRLGISADKMPGYGLIRRTLIELDLAHGSVSAFRLAAGDWELFKAPDARPGFIDLPLLPKDTVQQGSTESETVAKESV